MAAKTITKKNTAAKKPAKSSKGKKGGTKESVAITQLEREEKELSRLLALDLEQARLEESITKNDLWTYYNPFRWQERLIRKTREKLVVIAPSPNKIGKTATVACIIASWVMGYESWNEVDIDYPGAVKVGKKRYCKPSSLEIKPPVKIRLTGEDWNHHLGQTVVPELKKWFPVDAYDTKRNTNGVEYFWTFKNGSTLELLTHGMDDDLYESWFGHGWIPDEPPPEKKFTGMARGLFGNRGKILIPTTPLKESWILDNLILSNRSDVAVIDDLCCLDNEIFYDHDDEILTGMGLSGVRTKFWKDADGQKKHFFDLIMYKDDKGVEAEKYLRENIEEKETDKIMELYFLKFAKDTPLDEKPSRFFGMFKRLVGLVIKSFDKDKHIIPEPEGGIPTDWVVTVCIDLHLNKPHAISFYGCDKHNRHYCIDEYWVNCPPEEIADIIIRKKSLLGWNIQNAYIDPLSKGDDKFMSNRADVEDSFTIISNKLTGEGVYLQSASKDKESGMRNIRTWLEGPNKLPILFFFDTLQSVKENTRGVVFDIQRLCFDDNGKIEKINDDFMENLYRYTLTGTEYLEENTTNKLNEYAMAGTEEWLGA